MKLIELRDFIASKMTDWNVTIDEAEMVNIDIDAMEPQDGVIYIEEFITGRTTYNMFVSTVTKYDVTFVLFTDNAEKASVRQAKREDVILPAAKSLMSDISKSYNVKSFTFNTYPKGFDVAEVTMTISFEIEESTAC